MSSQDIQSINRDDTPVLPRLGKNSPTLSYFCVYNPSLGQSEENTKDQILYYTAKKVVPADVKMKQVGLAQALVNFTSTFSPSHPTQNVHSQKNRMIFLQPEPGFWIHMCVELGVMRKQIKDSKGKEKLVTEYLDSQLNDRALEAVLKIGYEQFKLLNGTFTNTLYGDNDINEKPNRQRTRSLMHAIEEFFSEWIWKWDFDRLDTMCFTAVFNGVPVQPILRNNYLRVNELDVAIKEKFDQHISHLFVLNLGDGGLVYRSPTLANNDVCSLRKYVLKKVEKYIKHEKRKLDVESASKKEVKVSGIKSFTKSISTSQILNYFTNGSKSSDTASSSKPASINNSIDSNSGLPSTSEIPTEPSSPNGSLVTDADANQGIFLTGLIETTAIGMNGEERPVTRSELVRVYITSSSSDEQSSKLVEYYLLVYKHKSNLVWSFLLPATSKSEDLISDPMFYTEIQKYMLEKNLDQLTDVVKTDIKSMQEKSLNLGKNYKCFYYDNATLNIKSTMIDSPAVLKASNKDKKATIQVTNDMLLQLLEVREDFEKIPRTSEVYTRSTSNHWIAGHRLYNTLRSTEEDEEDSVAAIHENRSSLDECSRDEDMHDYTEMYIIAAKKDTSLADVEETLGKMTTSLLDTMHIE